MVIVANRHSRSMRTSRPSASDMSPSLIQTKRTLNPAAVQHPTRGTVAGSGSLARMQEGTQPLAVERDKPFITRRGVVWFVVSCVATAALWGLFALGLAATSGSGGGVSKTTADSLCAPLGNTGVLSWGGRRGTAVRTE